MSIMNDDEAMMFSGRWSKRRGGGINRGLGPNARMQAGRFFWLLLGCCTFLVSSSLLFWGPKFQGRKIQASFSPPTPPSNTKSDDKPAMSDVTPNHTRTANDVGTSLPPFVRFDLRKSETDTFENYIRNCIPSDRGKHARESPIYKRFDFLTNSACRELAEHPVMVKSAQKVLGLPPDAPLWAFAVNRFQKEKGSAHRLHTDNEFSHPSCRPLGGATLWVMLEREGCDSGSPSSPFALFSGSHLLNETANQALIKQNCWSLSSEPLPCNVTLIFEEYMESHQNDIPLEPVQGPTELFTGIAWPSTAWHMTEDSCRRLAVTVEYVASLECAQHLYHAFPEADFGRVRNFPDQAPLLSVNGNATVITNALSDLLSAPSPNSGGERCLFKKPDSGRAGGEIVPNKTWHLSGPFSPKHEQMKHIGYSLQPRQRELRTQNFKYWIGRTHYQTSKKHNRAHPPHVEPSLEICTILHGRINYAINRGDGCDNYFDVMSLRKGQVAVLFPEILHTAAPDTEEDGEHLCVKIFPLAEVKADAWKRNDIAIRASRLATGSIGIDYDYELRRKRAHDIFFVHERSELSLPGFNRLHIKMVQYKKGEERTPNEDPYDLLAVVLDGELQLISPRKDNATAFQRTPIPRHQVMVIPAGTAHAFASPNGTTRVLFIEVAPS